MLHQIDFPSRSSPSQPLTGARQIQIGGNSISERTSSFPPSWPLGSHHHICGRYCNFIVVQSNPYETTMLMNQKLFVHLNGGIRLPSTVQGASRRVLSLSSSNTKVTSQQEDDGTSRSEHFPSVAGGIVALGKFDALHIGHRELAIQAAKAGTPFLLSFTGMAEVLGWEPRAPVVAKCDRERVLASWSTWCGEVTPTELEVEFSKVRNLTPRQFVEKLSKELGVRGVVAGT
ncbi:hypothetical protein SSX86_022792 [Deinandra increscens subsp. villosa]|uniref:FAD synthase n=1 Tax=Deinandra increscens subsp. villosa TaxID=3103831 RepID=A0AAP0CR96_9ASTR